MRRVLPVACSAFLVAATCLLKAQTVTGVGSGGNIPDNAPAANSGVFSSDATINGAGLVAEGNAVTVILKGLRHDWPGDLVATLSYLDSQGNVLVSANLFCRIGQSSDRISGTWTPFGAPGPTGDNYTFNTDAPASLWNVAAGLGYADFIPGQQTDAANGGSYFPADCGGSKSNLSYAFAGLDVGGGTWRLTITDAADHASEGSSVSNVGSLVGWEVDIQTSQTATGITARPSSGSGMVQTFTFSYLNPDQVQEHLFFNSSLTGNGSCYLIYDRPSNSLYIANDTGTAVSDSATPGSEVLLSNSQCSVPASTALIAVSGNTVSVTVTILFAPTFAGAKNIYGNIVNSSYIQSNWQQIGSWTVGGPRATRQLNTGLTRIPF